MGHEAEKDGRHDGCGHQVDDEVEDQDVDVLGGNDDGSESKRLTGESCCTKGPRKTREFTTHGTFRMRISRTHQMLTRLRNKSLLKVATSAMKEELVRKVSRSGLVKVGQTRYGYSPVCMVS